MLGEYDVKQIERGSLAQLYHIRIASAKYTIKIMDEDWLPSVYTVFLSLSQANARRMSHNSS